MPRDHAYALELQEKIDQLDEQRLELVEQMAEADPALAEQSELMRQTRTITDIAFLSEVSQGKLSQRYSSAMGRVLSNLSAEPSVIVGGKEKAASCKVNLEITLTSILGTEKLDGRNRSQTYLKDIGLEFQISAKVPKYESEVVTAAVIPNPDGSIRDVRVNPANDESPRQLALFDNGSDRLDE